MNYEPVPDDQLFEEVEALEAVASFDGEYEERFDFTGYSLRLEIESDADALQVIDHVFAIMWQGRPRADIKLAARQDGAKVSTLPISNGSWVSLEERYGPQPGDGEPPDD